MKSIRSVTAATLLALSLAGGVQAQAASSGGTASAAVAAPPSAGGIAKFHIRPADDAWRASLPRDADAATQAYLDRLPADVVAR